MEGPEIQFAEATIDNGRFGTRTVRFETGRLARQAAGSAVAYLDGEMSKDDAINMIITRTRQFAVRQERWFRRDPRVRWIDVEHDAVAEAAPIVIDALTA